MTVLPKTKHCILELKKGWLTIWFNRPEKRNALSDRLLNEIKIALETVETNRKVRGIIFRGKGGVFSAGADLKNLKMIASSGDEARELAVKMSTKVGQIFSKISNTPQVTISVVEGAGMAGAFGIACATDILITMADAKYALTETKIGLTPAQIMPYVISRLGFSQARELMLLGTAFNGQQAYSMGMADYLAQNKNELDQNIQNIKDKVRKCAPNAIAITKNAMASIHTINIDKAASLFSDSVVHEEGREGFASFFEKRKPYWTKEG